MLAGEIFFLLCIVYCVLCIVIFERSLFDPVACYFLFLFFYYFFANVSRYGDLTAMPDGGLCKECEPGRFSDKVALVSFDLCEFCPAGRHTNKVRGRSAVIVTHFSIPSIHSHHSL